ncbi:acetoin utilization protein AcuC [Anianabacter salinae]|uniref:acetoin utilization protein AcuC n=1 Tax=Anianabacter salinae TaxID=2851023 RepID=UPI00225E35B5|nr:acetoin utilization protein AcuC [Anianabacter salinae]MBV0912668.1 acetoin utilization protein AcuC [Anianabacter salinae]
MTLPVFIGSEIYRGSSYGGWHPLRVPRVSTVMHLCRALGWLPRAQFVPSPRARPAALHAFHTPRYIAALQAAERDQTVSDAVRQRHHLGTHSNPVYPEVFRRPATAAGASILAGEMLAEGGVVYSPASGTHHGMPDRANGFCYLNDPVLGLLSLRRMGVRRIAYVDIDAHHCDGVDHAFRDDPDMLLVSVHEERRWPFTGALADQGAGNVFNLPVPRGFNDTEMRAALDSVILPAVAAHRPDAVVLQCGADAVEEDPLSRLSLSNNAHWQVVAALRPLSPRYFVTGGGGYNPWTVGRLWSGVWATLTGAEIPDRLPPEAEAILRAVPWSGNSRARAPRETLFTALRDAPNEGPVRPEVAGRIAALAARIRSAERIAAAG